MYCGDSGVAGFNDANSLQTFHFWILGTQVPDDQPERILHMQQDIRDKLQTQLLANNTQGLPDIVLIQDDVGQKYLQSFPGAFVPLGDSIDMTQFAQYKVAPATLDLWRAGVLSAADQATRAAPALTFTRGQRFATRHPNARD